MIDKEQVLFKAKKITKICESETRLIEKQTQENLIVLNQQSGSFISFKKAIYLIKQQKESSVKEQKEMMVFLRDIVKELFQKKERNNKYRLARGLWKKLRPKWGRIFIEKDCVQALDDLKYSTDCFLNKVSVWSPQKEKTITLSFVVNSKSKFLQVISKWSETL
ncbi:MAG: hypothetical protein Q7T34_02400 [Candidatus Parcubacteria bacterium]|nr:hypothetical protein [Candidatus Parcubacteria bacterium]